MEIKSEIILSLLNTILKCLLQGLLHITDTEIFEIQVT